MVKNKVPAIEVKRNFLLANAGKRLFESGNNSPKLEEEYERIKEEIFSFGVEEFDERITDKVRLARYDSFDWYSGQKSFENIGPWPKMHSLDARLTTGNITDTARAIEEVKNGQIVLRDFPVSINFYNQFIFVT